MSLIIIDHNLTELECYILKVSEQQLPAYSREFGLKTDMSQQRSFIVLELAQPCLSSLSDCFSKYSHARWINCNMRHAASVFGGGRKKQRRVELAPSNGSTWSHGGNNNNCSKRLFEGWMLKVLCPCLIFLSFTIRDSFHTKLRCDNCNCRHNGYQKWLWNIAMLSAQQMQQQHLT